MMGAKIVFRQGTMIILSTDWLVFMATDKLDRMVNILYDCLTMRCGADRSQRECSEAMTNQRIVFPQLSNTYGVANYYTIQALSGLAFFILQPLNPLFPPAAGNAALQLRRWPCPAEMGTARAETHLINNRRIRP